MQALPSWPVYATLVFLLGLGGAVISVYLLRSWGPGFRERLLEGESRTALLQLTAISTMLTLALVGFATLVPVLVELLTLLTDR
jgi:cytochrome c biogenesis factor